MKRYDLVEISWIDSDHGSGWKLMNELNDRRNMECKSVGYLLDEIADTVRIVQSCAAVGSHEEQVNGILTIPKVAIKRKRLIK